MSRLFHILVRILHLKNMSVFSQYGYVSILCQDFLNFLSEKIKIFFAGHVLLNFMSSRHVSFVSSKNQVMFFSFLSPKYHKFMSFEIFHIKSHVMLSHDFVRFVSQNLIDSHVYVIFFSNLSHVSVPLRFTWGGKHVH